jgi:hypothetical protein
VPEELTFVVSRWLQPLVVLLHVVRPLSHWHRHLAVNNSVRPSITDSDALRSIGVPNFKADGYPVAF